MAFQRLVFTTFILILLVMSLSPQDFTINLVEGEVSYSQDVAWERTYGKNYTEILYDMIQTVDGGFALVGYAYPDVGGIYTYLVKTYANGSVEWTQNYSIGIDTYGESLIQTVDGGYAIAGWIISGNRDALLIKTDENGTLLWTKTYSSGPIDYVSSLIQTVDGGYALGGTTATQSSNDAEGWLVKTDANGNLQWSQKYGGAKEEEIYAIVQTRDGGYALAGRTMTYASGFYDFWLVKTNSEGVFQWNKTYGEGGQDAACSLIQTGDGGFALAGYVNWPGDAMVVKTDVNGAVEWSKQYGSADLEVGGSLDRRREGGYALAIQSGTKILFLELNSDGSIQSQAWYPTPQQFVKVGGGVVVQTDDGGYVIAGSAEISSYPYDSDFYLLKISGKDTDQDGLFDLWEQQGIDVNNDGNLELDLKALGANWQYKDLFVEVDYMEFHKPNASAINDVKAAFKNAPVLNPNGTSGINLHVIVDNEIAHLDSIKVGNESWGDFDTFKWGNFGNPADRANGNWLYIKEARHRVFRYCLFVHNYDGSTSSGLAEVPGNDFLVSLGSWTEIGGHKVGSRDEQAGSFMHELGHTLGLDHGGGDDVNGKPNYISIMSYSRQMPYRVPTRLLDYSRAKLPSLNESNLDENLGVQDPANITTVFGPPVQDLLTRKWIAPYYPSLGPIDWNQNGLSNDSGLAISINNFTKWDFGDANLSVLEGYNDWANIELNFRDTANYAEGVHLSATDQEITWEIVQLMRNEATGDTNPPITSHNYDGLWHTSDFTIDLNATDSSGIFATYYKTNGGSTQSVSVNGQPRITVESGTSTLEYWSLDDVGNEELPHKMLAQIKLDKTSPTGSIQINNADSYTTSSSATLTLLATDTVSGVSQVRYSNDGIWDTEVWETVSASKSWTLAPGDGTKTVYYQIKDNAGLTSSTYSDTIIMDTAAPTGSIIINSGDASTTSTSVTLTLTYSDGGSGVSQVRYSIDGTWDTETWENPSATKAWILTSGDGAKTVYYQIKDNAELLSSTYSDTITLQSPGPTPTPTPNPTQPPTFTPTPTIRPTPTPSPTPLPTPTQSPTPSPSPQATPTPKPTSSQESPLFLYAIIVTVAFASVGATVFILKKRR